MKFLMIGDILGKPGRQVISGLLPGLIAQHEFDLCIANAENLAGGLGVTPQLAKEMFNLQIDVLTSGNHIWDKKEIEGYLAGEPRLLRPANYPPGAPGHGSCLVSLASGKMVGVLNLSGRVFMSNLDCPFRTAKVEIEQLKKHTNIIIVDIHAEATSEKMALGWFLDGQVSAVLGTHTHVQTADERILPQGTAYLTDVGMTGPLDSIIGIQKELAMKRFLQQMPVKFEMAEGDPELNGAIVEVNPDTGRATRIERLKVKYPEKG